jgi:amidase
MFPARLSQHIKDLVANGRLRGAMEYLFARELQRTLRFALKDDIKKFDAILTVPASGEAPIGLTSTGDPIFCALWTFLGVPALTVPVARTVKGLSLGVQLVAPYRQDAHLLRTGKWIESLV